jgi:SNF2 family DNA or RNA helicase
MNPDLRAAFWNPPVFTHGIHLIATNIDLHTHQVEGVSWLVHLFDHHVNAILADEVGLGKTLQIIAFLAFLKEQRRIPGPHLIAMPGSVLATWKDEFAKWLPGCTAICYYGKRGPRRNLFENVIARTEFEVLLTPYSILEKDAELLATVAWRVIVFDEGHRLKNPKANVYKLVDDVYCADFRIIATATPFQNDIEELWSLLYLIAPHAFSSAEVWNSFFKSLDGSQDRELIECLHEILRPYILRRVKSDLDFDIPKKLEITIKCSPAPIQTEALKRSLQFQLDAGQKRVLSRKLSNSPALLLAERPPINWLISRSPKLRILDQIINKLVITNHRFLIYSQWTSMMDIICDFLRWRQVEFLRIDGSVTTRRRLEIMSEFTRPGTPYSGLILSTRSSAFGLNLQVADTVVLFDSDYNPFIELQASSRVHRLGQVNVVVVIRLMMVATGEEKILRLSRRKFVLGNEIIEGGKFNFKVSEEDRKKAIDDLSAPPPELVDPTDEQLNSVLSRAPEDIGVMQFGRTGEYGGVDEEESFAEWDEKVLEAFPGRLDPTGEESEMEWEDIA